MTTKLIAEIVCLFMFLYVVNLVRSGRLTFRYAAGWMVVSLLGLFASIFHQFIFDFSSWLGFSLPSNFIFFSLLTAFIFLGLLLTVFLCQQHRRSDVLAQKVGMLELEIKRLSQERDAKKDLS